MKTSGGLCVNEYFIILILYQIFFISSNRLSGISPFFYEDEAKVLQSVQYVKYQFDPQAFENISAEAKDFIKKCLVRAPE